MKIKFSASALLICATILYASWSFNKTQYMLFSPNECVAATNFTET